MKKSSDEILRDVRIILQDVDKSGDAEIGDLEDIIERIENAVEV